MVVPGVFEVVGAVASVLQLAGFVRYLFTKTFDVASKSRVEKIGWHRFVRYLDLVENWVKPCMNTVWQGNSAMIAVMEAVKLELEEAWILVSDFLALNRLCRRWKETSFKKELQQSREHIQMLLFLIPTAPNGVPPVPTSLAQVGHAHSGNEDLDQAFALSVFVDEYLTANRRGSSDQVHADEEFARAEQEREYIGSPQLSNQGGSSQVEDDDDYEELARGIQASFDIA